MDSSDEVVIDYYPGGSQPPRRLVRKKLTLSENNARTWEIVLKVLEIVSDSSTSQNHQVMVNFTHCFSLPQIHGCLLVNLSIFGHISDVEIVNIRRVNEFMICMLADNTDPSLDHLSLLVRWYRFRYHLSFDLLVLCVLVIVSQGLVCTSYISAFDSSRGRETSEDDRIVPINAKHRFTSSPLHRSPSRTSSSSSISPRASRTYTSSTNTAYRWKHSTEYITTSHGRPCRQQSLSPIRYVQSSSWATSVIVDEHSTRCRSTGWAMLLRQLWWYQDWSRF